MRVDGLAESIAARGLTYLGEGASQKKDRQRLKGLLRRIPHSPRKTKIVDLGCGDGTIGLYLTRLGYKLLDDPVFTQKEVNIAISREV